MDEFQEILQDFLIESFELIEQLDQDLTELEATPEDLELLNRIFRVAHTIKGASSFLNFDTLTKLTHHMEDVLNKARQGELVLTPDKMDIILPSIDMMKALLVQIRDTGSDDGDIDINDIVAKLDVLSSGGDITQSDEEKPATPDDVKKDIVEEKKEVEKEEEEELDYSSMSDAEVEAEINKLLEEKQNEAKQKRKEKGLPPPVINDIVEEAPPPKAPPPKAPPPKPDTPKLVVAKKASKAPEKKSSPATVEQTIRVDVKRLDHLMNLIGELVLGKNRLIKINDDVEERYEGEEFLEELTQVVSIVSLVTTDLQIAVMKTRMLAIGKVFNKFPRMIRDLSRELNKQIELDISGEETELDKSIVEEIGDPLVHIIRNSCDHGIEDGETRLSKGKSAEGTIKLKAYNEGNQIVIQITDDGKGLDPEMLKEIAITKKVISEVEADSLSNKEAFGLIFRPGFSTAASITNVSGRGVGMDVVKTNIEKLNGIIDIESEIDQYTTIKLKIPLTLAIIQALLVGVQEEYYAIPLASVLETVRITMDAIYSVESRRVMRLRDEVLPLVHLADIFDIDLQFDMGEHAYVVVLGLAESKIGVIVDTLVGQEEIVIKSLGEYLQGMKGVAGATIRGDGGVTLIVDVAAIMDMARQAKSSSILSSDNINSNNNSKKEKPSDYKVLIVDDSKTDRTIIKTSLKPLGITLVEAVDGLDGLNIIKSGEHNFDAILVDIEMPRMDGYTLAGEIKKFNKYKQLPLIAVTSRTDKSDRMRGIEAGMVEYITKPYTPDYILSVVKRNIKYSLGDA
jgi:two-component system chemotaxis sensor kinase CheA